MRNLLFRIILLTLGFSLALGLAEIAVRLLRPQETSPVRFAFHPELGDIPVPLQKGRRIHPGSYDFTFSNNSQGFRGSREFGPKKPGDLRLLLLGDSFTYGIGVNDDQTFASILERYLRQRHLAAEVINAGNPGRGTDYALKLFQTSGAKLKPEVTVLGFFHRDFGRNGLAEYYYLEPNGELQAKVLEPVGGGIKTMLFRLPGYNWLISRSQAANLVKQAAVNYLVKMEGEPGGAGAAAGLVIPYSDKGNGVANPRNRKLTEIYLEHLREAVKQAGSDLVICFIPMAEDVKSYREKQEISPAEQAVKEIIASRGARLLSLTPVLAASGEPLGKLYYPEGHWTPRAHALAGEYLGNYLFNLLQGEAGRQAERQTNNFQPAVNRIK